MTEIAQQKWRPTDSQVAEIISQRDELLRENARLRARPTEEELGEVIARAMEETAGRAQPFFDIARAVLALFPKVQP